MPTKTLGPWAGGLNLAKNRGLSVYLSDAELGEATNVIISAEGFVEPRPGCKVLLANGVNDIYLPDPPGEGTPYFAISIVGTVDTGADGVYAILQKSTHYSNKLYKVRNEDILSEDANIELLYDDAGEGVGRFTHLIVHSGFVADQGTIGVDYWYPKDTGVLLFTDAPGKTFIAPLNLKVTGPDSTPVVRIPTESLIPASNYGMIIKDRLFLFDYNANKMHWSPATYILDFRTDPATLAIAPWGNDSSGTEIIEPTTPEDKIKSVEFYNNNFYIFKRAGTFMFTYQLSPLTDGYLRKISDDMGAYDSTIFRENIVVINNRGVFRVEGTEFIDLQAKMNFRFEIPIDHPRIDANDIFITNFNNNILFGFNDRFSPNPGVHHYCMNASTGAWTKWVFNYTNNIATPGSFYAMCKMPNTTLQKMIFLDFNRTRFVYIDWKPSYINSVYHLDSAMDNTKVRDTLYFPNVEIKTTANVGTNILKYKKLYRYFLRMYLSEVPALITDPPVWTMSINYNNYRFDDMMNPIFGLYPAVQPFPDPRATNTTTAVYTRTYQVRLPQQRAKEFVFELKRRFSTIASDVVIDNPDADRPIKTGYYFLLSGLWFDYQDKVGI